MPALSLGEEEVEGAVPVVTFFLNAAQWTLRLPLIWTDLESLRGRDGVSLAVAGAGSRGMSVVPDGPEWSLVFVVVICRDFGGVGPEGATKAERECRRLKGMPSPSPLATKA